MVAACRSCPARLEHGFLDERWIRKLFITNGILCIASWIGYMLANQMFSVVEMSLGILAWAVIFSLATSLLAVFFANRDDRQPSRN